MADFSRGTHERCKRGGVRILGLFLLFLPGLLARPAAAQPAPSAVGPYIQEMVRLAEKALEISRAAEEAETIREVKRRANAVYEAVWGLPSGLSAEDAEGAAQRHGWETRWQVTPADFDSSFAARYGTEPPAVTDPQKLGIMGRGRYVRRQFAVTPDTSSPTTPGVYYTHKGVVVPLSNVIGWMRMDNGITKGELQPRVDLTYKWDAPTVFWRSTADTGWLLQAYAQALNILKTDYEGDARMARRHAVGMTTFLEKSLRGVDADGDGEIEPIMMEGGLYTALEQAASVGLVNP